MVWTVSVISPVRECAQSRSHVAAIGAHVQAVVVRRPVYRKSTAHVAARKTTSAATAVTDFRPAPRRWRS